MHTSASATHNTTHTSEKRRVRRQTKPADTKRRSLRPEHTGRIFATKRSVFRNPEIVQGWSWEKRTCLQEVADSGSQDPNYQGKLLSFFVSAFPFSKNRVSRSSRAIPLLDLAAQSERLQGRLSHALERVFRSRQFIMGAEVERLEQQLAERAGRKHAITVSSGTTALLLSLMTKKLQPGDGVFVPAFTFPSCAEVVVLCGATPIFVDVEERTHNLCPWRLREAIRAAPDGITPRGIIAVDLYGLPADYPRLEKIAHEHGLWLVGDSAQSFGATIENRPVTSRGDITITSFYPSKPLGAAGDGGAIFTDDSVLAGVFRSLREHGRGDADRYHHQRVGMTARMDALQAAILNEKLTIFAAELTERNGVAQRYHTLLKGLVRCPEVPAGYRSSWALYTVRSRKREALQQALSEEGIGWAVHYPLPLCEQPAYRCFPRARAGIRVSKMLSKEVLSIPLHPYLRPEEQERVAQTMRTALQ